MLSRSPSVSVPAGTLAAANNLSDLASAATARTNLDIYNDDEVHRLLGTRAIKDCLLSDGGTSNRRGEAAFGTKGAIAGMPASFPFEFDVPTSNPSANAIVFGFSATVSTPENQANALTCYIDTSGAMRIRQNAAAGGGDYRSFAYAGFRVAYSGLRVRGMVVFASPNSTTDPVVYINGVNVSASFSLFTNNPPNWILATLDTTKFWSSLHWPSGRFVPHAPILGALTAAEVLEWTQTGRLPTWCEVGTGSAVAAYTSNFAAGVDGWLQYVGDANLVLTGNVDSISGVDDVLEVLASGANRNFSIARTLTAPGKRYAVTFDYFAETGAFASIYYLGLGSSSLRLDSAGVQIVEGSWQTGKELRYTSDENTTVLRFSPFTTASGSSVPALSLQSGKRIWFKNIAVRPLGPLAKWEIQPVGTCYDSGTNKIPLLLTAGITPITNKRDWIIQGQTNTNGNQQLLGASVFVSPYDYTRHMIDWLETNGISTATVTIGSASGGTQYKGSAALLSGRNRHTLLTPVVASADIWIGANASDTLQHTIAGHIID